MLKKLIGKLRASYRSSRFIRFQTSANRTNATRNKRKDTLGRQHNPFWATVEKLTNWQRHQWRKAGYPGLRMKNAVGVAPFVDLRKSP